MTTAYCMIANGGKAVRPTLIDRIQDRWGRSVWRHDARECAGCAAERWANQEEPDIADDRKQIIDPHTAYQMTSIMEGVVQRGTASVLKSLGRPLAGKTGTTNEEKDVWFIGFTPDLAVGVFMGYDTPRPMGKGNTGGRIAAPIFGEFIKLALADKPPTPFRIPPGIKLVRVNARTGLRAAPGDTESIVEAFKPNEEPDDPYSVIGFSEPAADTSGDYPIDQNDWRQGPSGGPALGGGRGGIW
jgi:penicillin-binding protein 1A